MALSRQLAAMRFQLVMVIVAAAMAAEGFVPPTPSKPQLRQLTQPLSAFMHFSSERCSSPQADYECMHTQTTQDWRLEVTQYSPGELSPKVTLLCGTRFVHVTRWLCSPLQ